MTKLAQNSGKWLEMKKKRNDEVLTVVDSRNSDIKRV